MSAVATPILHCTSGSSQVAKAIKREKEKPPKLDRKKKNYLYF